MIQVTNNNSTVQEFESINELVEYISGRENNNIMKHKNGSREGSYNFCGTYSYDQSIDLLRNGDTILIDKLVKAVQLDKNYNEPRIMQKPEYNVHGYQASVPRHLQGIPTAMIHTKKQVQKQKVVNLVRSIAFNWTIKTDTIIEEAKKSIQIIQLVESRGYRVNLKLVWVSESYGKYASAVIQVKHSGEKLNISKLAFPLANPSMLRRVGFKWMEVTDILQNSGYSFGYGKPVIDAETISKQVPSLKDAYIIPSFVGSIDALVDSWNLK